MPVVPDGWAILRIRFAGPFVVARLRDSEGETHRAQWEGPFAWPATTVKPFAARVQALAHALPGARVGPYSTGPVPLALFVDVPRFLWLEPLRIDTFLAPFGAGVDRNRVQVVGFSGSSRRRREPFTLPFRVLSYGNEGQAALSDIANRHWVAQLVVKERGFAIDSETYRDADALEGALRSAPRDVVVTGQPDVAIDVSRRLPLWQRPRLIVSIGPLDAASAPLLPPEGTALASFGAYPSVVPDVLYGLVHDLPIHEAAKAAVRKNPASEPLLRVFADPFTNQSLRIRDALIALQARVEELELTLPKSTVAEFLTRVQETAIGKDAKRIEKLQQRFGTSRGGRPLDEVLGQMDASVGDLIKIRENTSNLRSLPLDFENFAQESDGLVPMANTSQQLWEFGKQATDKAADLAEAMRDPELKAILEAHQERVVDVAMQRVETLPILSALGNESTLAAGALYRLRVHIGNRSAESIVVGEQPPIDPLLPEPEDAGHLLEVVVQGKDFAVAGERTRALHLPKYTGLEPPNFGVRTPRTPGPAALRIHVFYRNHLVHSYLLQAQVTPDEERRTSQDGIRVTLDYARIERLASIELAQPRALAICMNRGATHEFLVKGSTGAGELTLPPLTFKSDVDAFLAELGAASQDRNKPGRGRIYRQSAAGAPALPDAAEVLRGFIKRGAALYQSMKKKAINSNPNVAKAIDDLKTSNDEKIQITRLEPNDVFPWVLLYDFNLPPALPDAPVCLGTRIGSSGNVERCGHRFDSGQYCVNGFWSVRHHLEELIKRLHEIQGPVTRPARHGVRLVCDGSLAGVGDLHKELSGAIGVPHVIQGPSQEADLLDLLWKSPPARPAILVLLGHMDDQMKPGVLDSPGILLQQGQWLTQNHLDQRLGPNTWMQPRPVVLLMACNAAVITATTVNDFVTSFHTAGAAAIIGAEAVVASDLASACARDIAKALWAKRSLGLAMTEFRRETLAKGNPLAFLFHAIGDVDLTIQ